MLTDHSLHIPFAQLPIEAKVLFYMFSMSAREYHCNWPHTSVEIYRDLERIWNAEELSPEDLRNWRRMSELLESQLNKCIPQQRNSVEPERKARRRRRK